MAVEQLGGVTHGVRGDCALALEIELAAGLGGEDHPEIESCEQLEPEGEVLIHIQSEGNTDSTSGAISLPRSMEGAEVVVFVAHQVGQMAGLLPQRTGAPVAGDEAPPPVKGVDGEGAVIGAQAAGSGSGGVGETVQSLSPQQLALVQVQVTGSQSGAEGAHDARNHRTGHIPAKLLLKGPEHRVIEEGASLDHNVLSQIVGGGGPDNLIYGVFHDGGGQTGGDIFHAGPVLLGLLDAGVHEHSAPGAQIYRMLGEESQLGEIRYVVAQSLGKGLNEGATAGGAGLVEHDGVHGAVADLKALHILTADVDDEIHGGLKVGGGLVVGHSLHQTEVAGEGVFDQVLAIAGDGGAADHDTVTAHGVDGPQLFQHYGHGVTQIGVVIGIQQAAVGGDEGQLGGGGASVDAQPSRTGVGMDIHLWGAAGVVPGTELVVLLLTGEQGRHGVHQGGGLGAVGQLFQHLLKGDRLIVGSAQSRAHGRETVAVLGKDGVLTV